MNTSESIKELVTALNKAQGEFSPINKSKTAKIASSKGSFSYKYADLAEVWDAIREHLAKNGLVVSQFNNCLDNTLMLTTMLSHVSGEFIKHEGYYPLSNTGNNPIQSAGAAITYARRYELCSILGLVADEDIDANIPEDKKPPSRDKGLLDIVLNKAKVLFPGKEGYDKFMAWRVDNALTENITAASDLELSKVLTALRRLEKENANI